MKSKKHLKRRKTSKKKTFQFERDGKRFKIKALSAQSALSKLLRKRVTIHESKVNVFKDKIIKLHENIGGLIVSLDLYVKNITMFMVIFNFFKKVFGIKTAVDIQNKSIKKSRELLDVQRVSKQKFELTRPYLNEFKICF